METGSQSSLLRQYEEQFGIVSADLVSKIGEMKAAPSKAGQLEKEANELVEDASDILEQVGLEIRALNGAEKQRWINRLKSYQAELKRILTELRNTKDAPLDDEASCELLMGSNVSNDQKQRLLSNLDKAEDSSRNLDRGYMAIRETEEIGAKILADLDNQRDALLRSQRKMRGVNVDLDESSRVTSRMLSRAYHNKAVLYGVLGLFGLALVSVIYIFVVR